MRPKFLFSFFFVLIVPYAYAQDTIYKRNNETVIAKVLEINQTEVKYKKYNYPDGPLYIDNKSDIKMIRYAGGPTEEFKAEPPPVVIRNYSTAPPDNLRIETWGGSYRYNGLMISEREAQFIMEETGDPNIISYTRQARKEKLLQFVGFGAIPLGIAAAVFYTKANVGTYNYQSGSYAKNPDKNTYLTLAATFGILSIACPVEAVISKIKRNSYNVQAVRIYNQKF